MPQPIVTIGKQFGRWAVESRAGSNKHRMPTWNCVCSCGKRKVVLANSLLSGASKSCGCSMTGRRHGGLSSKKPEYGVWKMMIFRCASAKADSYIYYGWRGITVCDRWRGDDGFVNFIADMGRRPSKDHSIERKDNDGDYCPQNCRWATRVEQGTNKRNNHIITVDGKPYTFAECLRAFGVASTTLKRQLAKGLRDDAAIAASKRTRTRRSGS